jgi:hypothetical protein
VETGGAGTALGDEAAGCGYCRDVSGQQAVTAVPDVVGFRAPDAVAMVRAAGLVPYGLDHGPPPEAGTVTAQTPKARTQAVLGGSVILRTGPAGGRGAGPRDPVPHDANDLLPA